MRIVAGIYRSRILKTLPGDNTRPTLDKVKEAVFSRIGPYFDGGTILDLFSGSGAISLEAISRGFDKAYMNDKNGKAVSVIKENIKTLKAEEYCEVFQLDFEKMIDLCKEKGQTFDLIYLDPPYALQLISHLLKRIKPLLKEKTIIVAESTLDEEIELSDGYVIDKQTTYGTIKVSYIKRSV